MSATTSPYRGREPSKLMVACLDGRRLKGYVFNFSPLRERFRLFPDANSPLEAGTDFELADLKALFFVKDFAGNPHYKEQYNPNGERGRKLEVTFKDGERLLARRRHGARRSWGSFCFRQTP
jgi:uncharacterized protein DUF6982